jgi:trans-2,3-dihydro-3-hydroxyanthranilate isomerase
MQFYIVDVFAENKYAGNQLAVLAGSEVADLSDKEMLQIAREINYSETTFIIADQPVNGGYPVRIFTPAKELPFAGHPTLGTAAIIAREIIKEPVEQVILNLAVGQIPVTFAHDNSRDLLWMKTNQSIFGEIFRGEQLAPILNLEVDDLDQNFPIQVVSTGIPFIIVPLRNLAALEKAKVNLDKFFDFIKTATASEIFIFCPETYHTENQLSARMFAPNLGIVEDPATGSANSCLAGYLVEHNYFNSSDINIRVEQGYSIQRPSLLFLKANKLVNNDHSQIDILVGGEVITVAKGEWLR